jgi:hypothetical protein
MLATCDLSTGSGKCQAAHLRLAAGAPASAELIAALSASTLFGDHIFVVCGRHRLRQGVPAAVAPDHAFAVWGMPGLRTKQLSTSVLPKCHRCAMIFWLLLCAVLPSARPAHPARSPISCSCSCV